MRFNPPTFASETVHLTAASGVFVRSQGLGSFSKHSQGRALGTAHGFENTDAPTAPGWLSAGRPFPFFDAFLAGRMKSLGTELHSLFEPVRRVAPGWLSAHARVSLSEKSQNRALGTARGFENTDAPTAPGWLSAGRPFHFRYSFLAGRMKSLGTELHPLFEPVRHAAPGWLSARPPVSLSKRSQNPAPGTAQGFAFTDADPAAGWLSASTSESFSPKDYHLPVLSEEVVDMMAAGSGKFIIDGTLGGGGHSELLLQSGASVLGVDRDPEALAHAGERLSGFAPRFSTYQANFFRNPRPSRYPCRGTRRRVVTRSRGFVPPTRFRAARFFFHARGSARHAHGAECGDDCRRPGQHMGRKRDRPDTVHLRGGAPLTQDRCRHCR